MGNLMLEKLSSYHVTHGYAKIALGAVSTSHGITIGYLAVYGCDMVWWRIVSHLARQRNNCGSALPITTVQQTSCRHLWFGFIPRVERDLEVNGNTRVYTTVQRNIKQDDVHILDNSTTCQILRSLRRNHKYLNATQENSAGFRLN